ncbi:MAG: hypothetical protein ACP5M1_13175, partial [Acidiphilium sp.]
GDGCSNFRVKLILFRSSLLITILGGRGVLRCWLSANNDDFYSWDLASSRIGGDGGQIPLLRES